ARVRREIVSAVSQESEAEEPLARVNVKNVLVEEIENTEIPGNQDNSSAVVMRPQLQRARLPRDALAAQPERLLYKDARVVNLWNFAASFLQLEVLNAFSQPPELRERS